MDAKPSELLIGVGELIGILLPGAVVTYLASPLTQRLDVVQSLPVLSEGAAWVAFVVGAYFAGHLVFLVGSFLDKPYDVVRQHFWPREDDSAYDAANEIRARFLGASARATNTYKFATALLALQHETAFAEVRQLEADSKFFRSLIVLALGLLVVTAATGQAGLAVGCLLAGAMCCWRYVERRWKATQRAYQYVVVLDALGAMARRVPSATAE